MSEITPINWDDKVNSPELLAFLQQFGEKYYLSADEINELRDKTNSLIVNRPTDISLKLDRGGYPGTAQDIVDSIHDPVDISGKLDKGGYTGTAKTLKDELELSSKIYTDEESQAVRNYTDTELSFKENLVNKAVDFNTINDILFPTVKSVKTQLDTRIPLTEKGTANGVASLGADGKIPNSQIPALAISDTFPINSQVAMLALSQADQGDVAVRLDLNKSFILRVAPSSVLENWQELLTPSDSVQSVNGQVGNVNLTTADLQDSTNRRYQTDNQKLFNDATSSIQTQLNGKQPNLGFTPEQAFSKNTAFNKNFGITGGTVAEGNDVRISNGQTAFSWGSHAGLYVPIGGNAVSASKWLTARTFTVGNSSKTVDGTANISWSLSEIGAQPLLTNPITGVVSTNYIPKSNGSGLVNSVISETGGNVSIAGNVTATTFIGDLNGTANSATNWGSAGQYVPSAQNNSVTFLMSYSSATGVWKPTDKDFVNQFLGLGSNAYSSIPYLPLTGGMLTGNLTMGGARGIIFSNGGDTAFIGASTHIDGGSTDDFNVYVTGQNPFGIWSNGVKRFEINAIGDTIINNSLGVRSGIDMIGSSLLRLGVDQGGGASLKYNSNGNLDISPRQGYNTVFKNGNVIVENAVISGTDVSSPLLTLQGGVAPYLRFMSNAGERRAYIQHDGQSLNLNCDFGSVSIGSPLSVVGAITGGPIISAKGGNPYFQLESGAGAQLGYFYHDGNGVIIKSTVQNSLRLENNTTVNGTFSALSTTNGYSALFNKTSGFGASLALKNSSTSSTALLRFLTPDDVVVTNITNNATNDGLVFSGTITSSGGFFNSDERLKDVVKRDGDVAYFTWKDKRDEKVHIGYIAQEVRKTNTDQVQEDKDGMLSVNYVEILVQKMSEMEKEMSAMRKEIKQMKGGNHGI